MLSKHALYVSCGAVQHFGKSHCVRQSDVKLLSNSDLLVAVALICEILLLVLLLSLLSLIADS